MELDGKLIVESAEIMRILEEAFPDNKPLLPPKGTKERQRADSLMRLERRLFSDWLSWLTTSWYTLHIKLLMQPVALLRQAPGWQSWLAVSRRPPGAISATICDTLAIPDQGVSLL